MDRSTKLAILADAAKYDASCASGGNRRGRRPGRGGIGSVEGPGICHSYTPDGRCVSLLKILFTNACMFDCAYCINRRSSGVRRASFTVDEVVSLTLDFYRRNYIEGLFLSSGIVRSADYTMERLVAVARTLRKEHRFAGYIHLKTIPDASPELIDEAGRWADRLSINIELPRQQDLDSLAPEKRLVQIGAGMSRIQRGIEESRDERRRSERAPHFAPAGQSTQMIVGATDARDADILGAASTLYEAHRLRRVYYSAFSPIPDASALLPAASPPLVREHRLYQADWLLRFYGFSAGEITPPTAPDLSLDLDPKTAWALRNRERFPIDLNRAPREMLLRVPGLGTRSVNRLLKIRARRRIRSEDLARLHVPLRTALPFLVTADHTPGRTLDALDLRGRLTTFATQTDLFGAPARPTREIGVRMGSQAGAIRRRTAGSMRAARPAAPRPISFLGGWDGWRDASREALAIGIAPDGVVWIDGTDPQTHLLDEGGRFAALPKCAEGKVRIPRRFLELGRAVACHRSPARWDRLYRVLWRLTRGERGLLDDVTDPEVNPLLQMEKAVRRDVHKVHAFVRFRRIDTDAGERYVAWIEPRHHTLERAAPFFVRRFPSMRWSILTPEASVHHDAGDLRHEPGVPRSAAPGEDALEDLWRTYYGHIFNPARIKLSAMKAEMPVGYRKDLPEAREIDRLVREAPDRVRRMVAQAAESRVPTEPWMRRLVSERGGGR